MDQLTVVGGRSVANEVLQALQNLGVVHVDPLEPESGTVLRRVELEGEALAQANRWRELQSRSAQLLDVLAEYRKASPPPVWTPALPLRSWSRGSAGSAAASTPSWPNAPTRAMSSTSSTPTCRCSVRWLPPSGGWNPVSTLTVLP